jgi:hypothetical protein
MVRSGMQRLCRLFLVAALAASPTLLLPASARAGDDDSPEKKLKAAEGMFRAGKLAEAETLLLGIAQPPAKGLQLLGQVQVRQKKYEEALKTYEKYIAVEKIPSKRAAGETLLAELKTLAKTRFRIVTTPPGATVFIDSKVDGPIGTTPITRQVTPGRHKVILELAGYEPINVAVAAAEQQELELPFVLIPKGCELTVTSQPEKAKVFIDGKGAGMTPVGRQLRSGTYRVEAILQPGDPPVVRQVICDDKDPKPLQVHLAPEAPGASGQPGQPAPTAPAAATTAAPPAPPAPAPKDAAKDGPAAKDTAAAKAAPPAKTP